MHANGRAYVGNAGVPRKVTIRWLAGPQIRGKQVMAPWLILIIGAVYLFTALDLLKNGQGGLALAFAGYAFSNIGLYLAAR